jgi:hypothetical protein
MAAKRRGKRTPQRQPWPTVLAAVVAALSLAFNGYQYLANRDLDRRIGEATAAKVEHEVAVELEPRYLVLPALVAGQWPAGLESGTEKPLLAENEVLESLRAFVARAEGGADLLEERDGVTSAHGAIVLRVRNNGAATAQALVLTVRSHDFPAGGQLDERPWLIKTKMWKQEQRRVGDLPPGRELYFPLFRLVGASSYLGTAYLPLKLTWRNATTRKTETLEIQRMAPEDQWMTEGLNVRIAQ